MYGTVCAVSALMMSAVVGVVCTSVYIRCKHKGNRVLVPVALHHQRCSFFTRENGEHSNQAGTEQCISGN